MGWRLVFGIITLFGALLLIIDLVTIGRREKRQTLMFDD
jgi:predicted MFS family arabinose efflux permease